MSLGSRIAKRARATINAGLASTPREPLFFLYPQWSRNSSSSAAEPDAQIKQGNTANTAPTANKSSLPASQAVIDSIDKEVQELIQSALQDDLAQTKGLKSATAFDPRHPMYGRNIFESHTASDLVESLPEVDRKPIFPEALSQVNRIERKTHRQAGSPADATRGTNNNAQDQKRFESHLKQMKEDLDNPSVLDWREILADLKRYTPKHGPWLEHAVRIVIPDESVETIINTIDDHIWALSHNHGCSVNLESSDEGLKGCAFIASGTLLSLAKLTADLSLSVPKFQIFATGGRNPAPAGQSADESAEIWKPKYYVPSQSRQNAKYIPPDKLAHTENWTPELFLGQVRAIIKLAVKTYNRRLGKPISGSGHQEVQALRELFQDPRCASSITRTACHEAMIFMLRMNHIEDVRSLFVRMSGKKMQLNVETFNIMLLGAAKNQNLTAFRFILHLMLNRGFVPNAKTWLAFMQAHADIDIRGHVFDAMKERGLLGNKSILKGLVFNLIDHEIEISLENEESQATFIASMDARFTPFWLSVWSGSRILRALASKGMISRCWEFMHFMHSRRIHVNTVCINTILSQCKEQRNLSGVLELLRSLPPTRKYVPNEETFQRLFQIGWQTQNYNFLRVVWRYACLYGATTYSMRSRVVNSILNATQPMLPGVGRERFRQHVGPVILGHSYLGNHPTQNAAVRASRSHRRAVPTANDGQVNMPLITKEESSVPGEETQPASPGESLLDTQSDAIIEEIEEEYPWIFDLDGKRDINNEAETTSDMIEQQLEAEDQADAFENKDETESGTSTKVNSLKSHGFSIGDDKSIFPSHFTALGSEDTPQPSITKKDVLDIVSIDLQVSHAWQPIHPMSLMLVHAAEEDKKWRAQKYETKRLGKEVVTEDQFYAERERLVGDAIGVHIRTKQWSAGGPRVWWWS